MCEDYVLVYAVFCGYGLRLCCLFATRLCYAFLVCAFGLRFCSVYRLICQVAHVEVGYGRVAGFCVATLWPGLCVQWRSVA